MFKLSAAIKENYRPFLATMETCVDEYSIVDGTGQYRVSAKSYLGLVYALTEFKEIYLVNNTTPNYFPAVLEEFRENS